MLALTNESIFPTQNIPTITGDKKEVNELSYARKILTVVSLSIVEASNLFDKYVIPSITEKKNSTSHLEQGDFINLANDIFKTSKPLTGEAYDIMTNTWLKSLKNTSTIEGML